MDHKHEEALASKWSAWMCSQIRKVNDACSKIGGRYKGEWIVKHDDYNVSLRIKDGRESPFEITFSLTGQSRRPLTNLLNDPSLWPLLYKVRRCLTQYIKATEKEIQRCSGVRSKSTKARRRFKDAALRGFAEDLAEPALMGEI